VYSEEIAIWSMRLPYLQVTNETWHFSAIRT